MPRSADSRRIATVLFLDIVGSTALASELGDARWRELLICFRRTVRAQLRRHGGREQDTAGDGFFATFDQPADALRAAAAITAAVQELGIDIRSGIHVGECEQIDGKLGGIAVHIGARVMSLAGAAEVLATSTVRDLVSGSGATFEDRGMHELKGVEGSWHVFAVRAVEVPLPSPLSPEEAATRLAQIQGSVRARRRRRLLLGAAVAVLVALAVAVPLATIGGHSAHAATPVSLLRLDGNTGRVVAVSKIAPAGRGLDANLRIYDGVLWQLVSQQPPTLVIRDLRSATVKQKLVLPRDTVWADYGFGSLWVLRGPPAGKGRPSTRAVVERINPLSGRLLKTTSFPGTVGTDAGGTIAAGNGAVWVLEADGTLVRIDPVSGSVDGRYRTGAVETTILIPLAGNLWICECSINRVMRFDVRTHTSRTFRIAQHAFLVGVDSSHGKTLWLLDPNGKTLTPMDPATGRTGASIGLGGEPAQAVVAFGSVWAAAGRTIQRVDLATRRRTALPVPKGIWASSIAADNATRTIWVGNRVVAPPPG
jgi:class 3 adenylate cyclase